MQEPKATQSFLQPQSGSGALVEGLTIGLLQAFDDWLGAKLLAGQAKTVREQNIAKVEIQQKKLALDERMQLYREQMGSLQVDQFEHQKTLDKEKSDFEAAKAASREKSMESYNKTNKAFFDARSAYITDPTPENTELARIAAASLQNTASTIDGLDISHVDEFLKKLDADKEKSEKEEEKKSLKEAKEKFSDNYLEFVKTDPESEDYKTKKAKLLTSGLNIDDDIVKTVIGKLFTKDDTGQVRVAQEAEPEVKAAYEKALSEYTTAASDGTEDLDDKKMALQSAGLDYINNQSVLGKNTSVIENTLRGLGITKEDKEDNEPETDQPMTEADKIREKSELQKLMDKGAIDQDAFNTLTSMLETDTTSTNKDYETILNRYLSQKMTGDLGGDSNYERREKIMNKFPTDSAHRPMLDTLLSDSKTELTGSNVATMLHGKRFDELTQEERDDISTQVMAKDEGARGGDEITNRLLKTPRLTIDALAGLYQQYQKVKDKLGLVTAITEGGFKFVGKTEDAEVAAFVASANEYIDSDVRLRTGAQVNRDEFTKAIKRSPNPKNTAELNDALFEAIGTTMRIRMTQDLSRRYGKQWGEQHADYIYNQAFDVAEDASGKPSRTDPSRLTDKELADAMINDYKNDRQTFIDNWKEQVQANIDKGSTAEKQRSQLETLLKDAGFETEIGEGITETILETVFEGIE